MKPQLRPACVLYAQQAFATVRYCPSLPSPVALSPQALSNAQRLNDLLPQSCRTSLCFAPWPLGNVPQTSHRCAAAISTQCPCASRPHLGFQQRTASAATSFHVFVDLPELLADCPKPCQVHQPLCHCHLPSPCSMHPALPTAHPLDTSRRFPHDAQVIESCFPSLSWNLVDGRVARPLDAARCEDFLLPAQILLAIVNHAGVPKALRPPLQMVKMQAARWSPRGARGRCLCGPSAQTCSVA
mmetsp:Transcript_20232/g.47219  ORF Transcript_20232/g.47219 Transcript_20232/m.47219 type:complete len:242 (-) Transcript_20232:12-737(-)